MNLFQAVLLGIVQGLTEFLPVSSSAHLALLQNWLHMEGEILLPFDVIVHLGTLLAVVLYFLKDIFPLKKLSMQYIALIVIASIPTALIGFMLKDRVEAALTSTTLVAVALLFNTAILWTTLWTSKRGQKAVIRKRDAFGIGVLQGLAVTPGISRSGITISGGMALGIKKEDAFRFSFLASIPAILGATVLIVPDAISIIHSDTVFLLLAGFITSFVSGYFAISVLFRIVIKERFHYFAWYTLILAFVTLISPVL